MGLFDIFKKQNNNSGSKTAETRKQQTEKLLKSMNIQFIDHLPQLEEENETKIRSAQEIAERILILVYLGYVAEVPDGREEVVDFLKTSLLWDKVTPKEKLLFQQEEMSEQEKINASWRTEAVWLLLWTINKVDKLDLPTEQIYVSESLSRIPDFLSAPNHFIETATVRSTSEILDISDLIYRIHWAARNAHLQNQAMPANLNLSIITERHYAINWVTFYGDNWDEITTDT